MFRCSTFTSTTLDCTLKYVIYIDTTQVNENENFPLEGIVNTKYSLLLKHSSAMIDQLLSHPVVRHQVDEFFFSFFNLTLR